MDAKEFVELELLLFYAMLLHGAVALSVIYFKLFTFFAACGQCL